jgi:predicted dehydrogenase/threonine dehydrogenase-like Zn-dependent dehydrogenase
MKQVLQYLNNGRTEVVDAPCPAVKPGHVLVQTRLSLISAGTERMLLEFGKANLLAKARQQPDKVRQVLDKIATDGLFDTIDAVRSKLDQPIPMGYCNVGTVLEVGKGVTEFTVGDRVVSNGSHAEVVCVPKNLCARIPENVDDETAALTVIGAIALQGIRLAQPTLGEAFVVSGLGLVGLMTVQLLRAHGCRVLGADFSPERLRLAEQFGAETVDLSAGKDPITAATAFSRGRGVDGVIITAATSSNEPMHQAATMCRKRGRIVLVGVVGLELSRADFYEKELTFQVSCSYGPGRYDADYEQRGRDYPLGFVRWTEQRNFEAVLDMMAAGQVDGNPIISHRYPLHDAAQAYEMLGGKQSGLGVVLEYPQSSGEGEAITARTVRLTEASIEKRESAAKTAGATPSIGFLGAGGFSSKVLIPAFRKAGARLQIVASAGGLTGLHAARKFGFAEASTDPKQVLENESVDTVVVATRHDTHAEFVCQALEAGKHVFVEKPLALNEAELGRIAQLYEGMQQSGAGPLLMVGFNRRFAPQVRKTAELLASLDEPKAFVLTVNAGAIPADHWVQDDAVGGGRIIGEGCHFIDLLRFLCGSPIIGIQATRIGKAPGVAVRDDKMTFTLTFADGSFGTVHYLANGHRAFPKERLEVFCAGRVIQLDNFRKLRAYGWKSFKKMNLWRQDKGHAAEVQAFCTAIRDGLPAPISFAELVEVTRTSFNIVAAAANTNATEETEANAIRWAKSA